MKWSGAHLSIAAGLSFLLHFYLEDVNLSLAVFSVSL